jgi:hypothetical protein
MMYGKNELRACVSALNKAAAVYNMKASIAGRAMDKENCKAWFQFSVTAARLAQEIEITGRIPLDPVSRPVVVAALRLCAREYADRAGEEKRPWQKNQLMNFASSFDQLAMRLDGKIIKG